jgi:ABC-type multidrug transport system fused ATPase/permease subunit
MTSTVAPGSWSRFFAAAVVATVCAVAVFSVLTALTAELTGVGRPATPASEWMIRLLYFFVHALTVIGFPILCVTFVTGLVVKRWYAVERRFGIVAVLIVGGLEGAAVVALLWASLLDPAKWSIADRAMVAAGAAAGVAGSGVFALMVTGRTPSENAP